MLGLQLLCLGAALWLAFGARKGQAGDAGTPWLRWLGSAMLSFLVAFIAHIIALNLLKHGWPEGFANPWIKRPLVALAWGSASALGIWLALRPRPGRAVLLLCAIGGALAYLIFALWRA